MRSYYLASNWRYFLSILTAIVEICSVGAGLVKIAGVETEFFLTIDDSGILRATVSWEYIVTLLHEQPRFQHFSSSNSRLETLRSDCFTRLPSANRHCATSLPCFFVYKCDLELNSKRL